MVNTLHQNIIHSWPTPNYVNPETQGPALVYVCIVFSALGIFIVSARLYSRFFITKAIGIDDALAALALGFGIALSVLVVLGNNVWMSGYHIWDIPPSKYVGSRLNIWSTEWCYVIATSATKISVLLFYRRLSVSFSKPFMVATWVGIVYNICYLVGFCLALLLMCRPINAYWDSFDLEWVRTHSFTCGSEQISLPLSGVFSVIGDFYSAVLPMLVIVNLDLPHLQKLSLYALFSLAFIVVAAGVVRTILLNAVINRDYDFTWILWKMWIWSLVEMYFALLAASAPALKPFFRRFLVEPLGSVSIPKKKKNATYSGAYSTQPIGKGWSVKSSSVRDSTALTDVERIGVAYGGSDTKSREQSFVREVDDDNLETRLYELRHSREGKIVPMQIWKKNSLPNLPYADNTNNTPRAPAQQGHVRNFSQPHSYTSSDATAVTTSRYMQRKSSQGSFKAAGLAAGAAQHTAIYTGDVPSFPVSPITQLPPLLTPSHGGRGSRLDPPTPDTDSEIIDYYSRGSVEASNEKPSWNTIHSLSRSRTPSVETLNLPRMGSKSFDRPETSDDRRWNRDFDPEKGTRWGREIGHGR